MPPDRFDKLEGDKPLPDPVKDALSRLGRFNHLEIGATPPPSAPQTQPHAAEKSLCLHCGQSNEKERQTCWACFKPLKAQAPSKPASKGPEDITIVLDGLTYRSSDQNLPKDIKKLMDQIREKGFSQELLAQWRAWRATRNAPSAGQGSSADPSLVPVENQGKDPLTGNEVFKGQRSSVIRLDGKIYTSTDPELSPQMKELFQYIETYGVTPALMEHLRLVGKKAIVRPATTTLPSDGDLAFWKDVTQTGPSLPEPQEAPDSGQRAMSGMILAGAVALYVLLRLFFAHP